jgi:AGCS family alanine or glycine:cation symporter
MRPLIETIDGFMWGYVLVFLHLGPVLHLALIKRKEPTSEGDISHFQALMTALAAAGGTGACQGRSSAMMERGQ